MLKVFARTEVEGVEQPFVEQDNGGAASNPDTTKKKMSIPEDPSGWA